MTALLRPALVGLLPVVLFLCGLIYLDSYKLLRLRSVVGALIAGAVAAGVAYLVNVRLMGAVDLELSSFARYVAPVTEEIAKAAIVVYLLRSNRIGFLVDASIFGFAVGTGFAVVENLYYLGSLFDAHIAVWLIRGCGTAIMHGGTTAIVGIVAKALSDRRPGGGATLYLPGLLLAIVVHSAFNHFFLSPLVSTFGVLLLLPPLILLVFRSSESSLQGWLDVGFDADTELLELIHSGEFSQSRVGHYLASLKQRFRGEVVADLLCYLRLHVELSLRAKGLLMMREKGFRVDPGDDVRASFAELRYLERSIGKTGKLAMAPFLHLSGKELWQLYMLGDK